MQILDRSFESTNQFSHLILDYLKQDQKIRRFSKYPPSYDIIPRIIEEKKMQELPRQLLVERLQAQYEGVDISEKTKSNITALADDNTFTITTAHQLNIFTGPLYLVIKIMCAINMAEKLQQEYPEFKFVPVYWLGSEDHDFEEINHTYIFGKKVEWHSQPMGAVGSMKSERLRKTIDEVAEILGQSDRAQELVKLFEEAYLNHKDMASAMRYLVNELFKEWGLVVLDADDAALKREFIPIMKEDLFAHAPKALVSDRIQELQQQGYHDQAFVRDINLFYMKDGFRERIEYNAGNEGYEVLNTHLYFSEEALRDELQQHPECFSPNVILRPLYQEFLLPNLAYVGGGGELAYWLQLEAMFEHYKVNFPMLVLRNSLMWIDGNTARKMTSLGLEVDDLWREPHEVLREHVKEESEQELSLAEAKEQIRELFTEITAKAKNIDPTLEKPVAGEAQKTLNSIEKLEAKLLKAEKRKHETALQQIEAIYDKLLPNGHLQERHENFSSFYLRHGREFFQILKDNLKPVEKEVIVVIE